MCNQFTAAWLPLQSVW